MTRSGHDAGAPADSAAPIERRRYRRVRRYFARVFLHLLWHDVVLARPLLSPLRSPGLPRWVRLAAEFRTLAIELGGVLIKLGQFLSTRVDLLPAEVIRELAGLQDRVPPAPFEALAARIEADLGRPLADVFSQVDPVPLGAASFAQVHRARLHGHPDDVVIKALRPGIEVLVATDLAATRAALKWLRLWGPVRRRVDLDRLYLELERTTEDELDLTREAAHIERFRHDFAGEPGVAVPRIYPRASARATLTLEAIDGIKIDDLPALAAAGIDPAEVARRVYQLYMQQLFVHSFVHCDPHPGNLFVRPLPPPTAGEAAAPAPAFEIVFIDFGMVTVIPARLRRALSDYAIALATRDSRRLVQSYVDAGVLLPGADLARIEQAHDELFARFWGVKLGDLQGVAMAEARSLYREFRDLLLEAPVQFPVDLLFALRAVGLLAGLATSLDAQFDPWSETQPFAARLAREEFGEGVERLFKRAVGTTRTLLDLPAELARALAATQRGGALVQITLAPDARRAMNRLEAALHRLAWTLVAAALIVTGAQLEAGMARWLCWGGAALCFLVGWLQRARSHRF